MRKLLSLLLLLAGAACTDTSAPDTSFTGTYALHSIDGETLPVTVYELEGDFIRILSGSITLRADNTFTTSTTATYQLEGQAGTETNGVSGTFTRSGDTFQLTDEDGEVYTMSYDGTSQLSMTDEGTVIVYRK